MPFVNSTKSNSMSISDTEEALDEHNANNNNNNNNNLNGQKNSQWEEIQKKAFYLEDIVESKGSGQRIISSPLRPAKTHGLFKLLNPLGIFFFLSFLLLFCNGPS